MTLVTDPEVESLPLSALQHYAYCPRQFALIHVEQQWVENRFTAEGRALHQRVDDGVPEQRGDLRTARSLWVVSRELGLSGIADVVEFHKVTEGGCVLPGKAGQWQPYPVEYKRGRSKADDWDRIQLCAQAMALEEMLATAISEGAIFYGKPRRREQVLLDAQLREKTRQLASAVHSLFARGETPAPEPGPKCDHCSLREICVPDRKSARAYLQQMLDGE